LGHAQSLPAHLDLLILDESQDLEPAWAEALVKSISPSGRLYVMGDSQQQIYDRDLFNLPDAVTIRCMDNFRSPQRLVELVNELRLTPEPMLSRSACTGSQPHFDIWKGSQSGTALEASLQRLWADGYLPSQVAVISYKGQGKSEALTKLQLGGFRTRRMTGRDSSGSEVWSEGPLIAETLSRFKGQSAPAVVLCEIDFETMTERDRRKLLVGLTRGQMRVDLVLSEQAARALSSLLR
jgi:superfamily I DNA/RNA helicase